MGQTIKQLYKAELKESPIFRDRFCIEFCEKVHVHYRNLRFVLMMDDFINLAQGFVDALERWKKRGCPGTGEGVHIELMRKKVNVLDGDNNIQVNLNKNLYLENKDKIFADGAEFFEDRYIHLKLRDIRLEMSISEFKELRNAIEEANKGLEGSDLPVTLSPSRVYE